MFDTEKVFWVVAALLSVFLCVEAYFVYAPPTWKTVTWETEELNSAIRVAKEELDHDFDTEIYLSNRLPNAPKLEDVDTVRVAACYSDMNVAFIKHDHWKKMNRAQKLTVILHEAGHCEFGMEHDDSKGSIMHPASSKYITTDKELEIAAIFMHSVIDMKSEVQISDAFKGE